LNSSTGRTKERYRAMPKKPQQPTPQWQPISQLPIITQAIDGMLESAQNNLAMLDQARPGSLDNYTIGRVVEVFTTQRDDLWLYDEQLKRWRATQLTQQQRREVDRLTGQLPKLRKAIAANLALADKLKGTTIETILGKSDAEVGLDFLLRGGFGVREEEE
jgi:hypothetical protein